jgi:hypothetical protein
MSCLFNSLSYFNKQISADQLRQIICDYLLSNPKILDTLDATIVTGWEMGCSLEQYVDIMRKSNTWGGGIEIRSYCNIFNIQVNIIMTDNKIIEFLPDNNKPSRIIGLLYTGNHYEPIKDNL